MKDELTKRLRRNMLIALVIVAMITLVLYMGQPSMYPHP